MKKSTQTFTNKSPKRQSTLDLIIVISQLYTYQPFWSFSNLTKNLLLTWFVFLRLNIITFLYYRYFNFIFTTHSKCHSFSLNLLPSKVYLHLRKRDSQLPLRFHPVQTTQKKNAKFLPFKIKWIPKQMIHVAKLTTIICFNQSKSGLLRKISQLETQKKLSKKRRWLNDQLPTPKSSNENRKSPQQLQDWEKDDLRGLLLSWSEPMIIFNFLFPHFLSFIEKHPFRKNF